VFVNVLRPRARCVTLGLLDPIFELRLSAIPVTNSLTLPPSGLNLFRDWLTPSKMLQRNPDEHERAEAMAVRILGFLASDSSRLEGFLRVSGIEPHEVRQAAGSPGFLAGVMDYALQDEKLLLAFCESEDIDPKLIGKLRRSLPGVSD
jgi:hypothetical protein